MPKWMKAISLIGLAILGVVLVAAFAKPASAANKQASAAMTGKACPSPANSVRGNSVSGNSVRGSNAVCNDGGCTANEPCCTANETCGGDCSNAASCDGGCTANRPCCTATRPCNGCPNAASCGGGGCTAAKPCLPPGFCRVGNAIRRCPSAGAGGESQGNGRYMVWLPDRGCRNDEDWQVVPDLNSEPGTRMAVYVDGYRLDATGGPQFIGATCDDPSKFGTFHVDSYYVAPNGLQNGPTDSIADPAHMTDALYLHVTLTSDPINPYATK